MPDKDLIEYLSEQYSIPKERLTRYISQDREIIGLTDPQGNESFKRAGGRWEHYDIARNPREFDPLKEPPGYHLPIYGDKIVRIKMGRTYKEFKVEGFLKRFPSLILFVVPLYGAFEYSGDKAEVQESIRKFALDFGKRVGKQVMVFDFWTEEHFSFSEYQDQQKTIMDRFGISGNSLPALLVSNRSPFNWKPSDKDGKCVVLTFKNFSASEIGQRLRTIALDLNKLQLPSKWGHNWSRFIIWCKSHDIMGTIFGAVLGLPGS